MRTGAYAPGGIEIGILEMGFAQMARYCSLPSSGYMGLTNSKLVDAKAGCEKGMSPMAGLPAGLDYMNMAGLIDALMALDFAMLVIDNEIGEMIKRVKRGLEFSEENITMDVIADAGPAGMFRDRSHTLELMKTCAALPNIADRDMRETWEENGALDAQSKAMRRVCEILTHDNPALFSPDLDVKIRSEFEGLVEGDSIPPLGWKTPAVPTTQ